MMEPSVDNVYWLRERGKMIIVSYCTLSPIFSPQFGGEQFCTLGKKRKLPHAHFLSIQIAPLPDRQSKIVFLSHFPDSLKYPVPNTCSIRK